jgi:dihydrodiol dehydrogenase / D-xylose 1-dehydrogenase (NADP)
VDVHNVVPSTMSIPPPPLDDPSVSDPLECPPLCWGVIGCGRVSSDFVQALKHLPSASVVACAARSEESAKTFAAMHKVPKYYGDYDDLLADDEVQIVYVGNIHSFRRQIGEKCLKANKHVLLEKPFACSAKDAEHLISLAKERKLFLMEGMWTRFFPAVEQARRLVFGSGDEMGVIGEVVSVHSDFNFKASDHEHYPSSFVYDHALGGGASFLVAPYPIAASTLFFGGGMPDNVKAVGQVDERTGVDLQAAMVLSFPPTGDVAPAVDESNMDENTPKLPGCGVATLLFGMLGESEEETVIVGTKGRLILQNPGHCPTKLRLITKGDGHRGDVGEERMYEYPVPVDTEEITNAGGYFYPNSAGFAYEAAAVARCIGAGKTEAPQFPLSETLINMKLIDELRAQLGVKPLPPS